MLAEDAQKALAQNFAAAIVDMGLGSLPLGLPHLVEKKARDAEQTFQHVAKAAPRKEEAYAAALAFMGREPLDARQRDSVASMLAVPIREHGNVTVLSAEDFPSLLAIYDQEVANGELWRLTWHGLLTSYFSYDISRDKDDAAKSGWSQLRDFLRRTWPYIDRQSDGKIVPTWVKVLRTEQKVLSEQPADSYAHDFLHGQNEAISKLSEDLAIPEGSWFWHALVLAAVRQATSYEGDQFQKLLPKLLELIKERPAFRDEAIKLILNWYYKHAPKGEHKQLRDYVVDSTVWKNPKLRIAGIATSWTQVSDEVWRMALSWVNEANLKDFFVILAARNQADEGRLAFWSRYIKQITWTRLVFSDDTMALKHRDLGVRELIAREEGAYAQMRKKSGVDAFMMQIDNYLIVEFAKKPNACYVYVADELPFEPHDRYYNGGADDLAVGLNGKFATRIVHTPGWESRAADALSRLGILPDSRSGSFNRAVREAEYSAVQSRSSKQQGIDLDALHRVVAGFKDAYVRDGRANGRGRLWVNDPRKSPILEKKLEELGFEWSSRYKGWFYPER